MAYPGGRCDPGEPDAESAALREASEEVGIQPQDVTILGKLRDMLTISNYRVTPIVGMIPWPYPLIPQTEETMFSADVPVVPIRIMEPLINKDENRIVNYDCKGAPVCAPLLMNACLSQGRHAGLPLHVNIRN